MTWKKSIIFCVSFLTFYFGEIVVNIACGGEVDPYDYYISYFHNDVQGKDYEQFNYTDWQYLYYDEEKVSEYELNSAEWANYLKVNKADFHRIMYTSDSTTNAQFSSLSKENLNTFSEDVKSNSFVKGLLKSKNALAYFKFAKSCEPFAVADYDRWDAEGGRDSTKMIEKAQQAIAAIKTVKRDNFLKLRYAYQAVRMYHYAENYEACKSTYQQYVAPLSSADLAKGWAMAVYAGSVRYGGNPTEAAYLYSKVFANNTERRVQAYKNFHYTSAAVEEVLPFAQNDLERANIIAIAAFGKPELHLDQLKKVYGYAPSSLLNGTLLVREVNKLEQQLNANGGLTGDLYSNWLSPQEADSVRKTYLQQLEETKAFALQLSAEKKYPEPQLGIITAAYLSWLKEDDKSAIELLKQLNPDQLEERYQNQYRIITLLINSRKLKQGNNFNEDELLPTLKWLDEKRMKSVKFVANNEDDYFALNRDNKFIATTRNFYQQLLAPSYLKMGDTARAALAMLKGDDVYEQRRDNRLYSNMSHQTLSFWQKYLSANTMQKLEKRYSLASKDNFEGWLNSNFLNLSKDDFYELFGTAYLRNHQYEKAIACFKKLAKDYPFLSPIDWDGDTLYADPFITTVNDYPKQYGTENKQYNKLTFAMEMLRLEKLTVSDKKNAALYYFKMANGVYQTGYYGNAWALISYSWSSYANYEKPSFFYDGDYKLAKKAKQWYLKARSLSKDTEFRAKCTFMLAKCEQKEKVNGVLSVNSWWDNDAQNQLYRLNRSNPYFKELQRSYANTKYYRRAVEDCSYLSDFLAIKK
ncbi:hypothetical protein [Pedobacter sp.]